MFYLRVEDITPTRDADDRLTVDVDVLCSATYFERISDRSTGRPGTCPASEWCVDARWFPRSSLQPTPREEGGELLFDVPLASVTFATDPVATAEGCATDASRPMDGETIALSARSDEPVPDTELVVEVVLRRRQADVPGDFYEHSRDIVLAP